MQLAGVRASQAWRQLKPERLVQPKVRKAFPDTAYWVADVSTGANGEAQVQFNFPDASPPGAPPRAASPRTPRSATR